MYSNFLTRATLIGGAALALSLAGCGGGGSSAPSSVTLTGLAATGAGIANGTVTARCASGPELTGATDGGGVFTLDLGAGRTLPCMLKVSGGSPSVTLYSFAQTQGRVNITPATDLVVARALGPDSDPDATFATFNADNGQTIESNLSAAKTYVNNQLNAIVGASFGKDLLSGSFAIGDADDQLLDAFGAALNHAEMAVSDLREEAKLGDPLPVSAFLAVPGAPTATANSASQITLTWGEVPGATSYKVFKSGTTGTVNTLGTVLATPATPSFVDTGLSASTAYYYKVVATNAVANSSATLEVTATTSAASGGGGSASGLTCDTTKFQSGAPVVTPTADQLATFARTYTGSEGSFGPNLGDPFVATGSATLVFNANGTATYNNAAYAPSSYCLETLSGGSTQLVIHSGLMSHFDLKANGAWSGYTADGKVVKDTPYSTGGGVSTSGWGSATVRSAALSADRVITPNLLPTFKWENTMFGLGRDLRMARSANPLQGDAGQDIVGLRFVAATGQVLSASVALIPDPTQPTGTANYVFTCTTCTGVTVDLTAGTVTFADTPLTPTILSGTQQSATLSGTYRLPDWRPRSGTTVSAATLAACVLSSNATGATFSDIGCLNGTYVGTGIEGQACTVQIDTAAQTFRFDDGVKNNTFGFSSGGGFTNLGTFRSAFTQSATLSRPGVPLENISFQASPSPVVPEVTIVDLQNLQSEGGTLNAVYSRSCRIEFDRRMP